VGFVLRVRASARWSRQMQLYRSDMLKIIAAHSLMVVVEHDYSHRRPKSIISLRPADGRSLDARRLGLDSHLAEWVDGQFLDHCVRFGLVHLEDEQEDCSIYAITEEGLRQARDVSDL
jgi:hypothetical protein